MQMWMENMLNNLVITEMYLCNNYYPYFNLSSQVNHSVCSGNQNAMMSGEQLSATIYKTSHQALKSSII